MQRALLSQFASKVPFRFIALCITGITLLSACATTTRPGVVGVNRQQMMMASQTEVERLSVIGFNEQNKKAQEKKDSDYIRIAIRSPDRNCQSPYSTDRLLS